MAPPFSVFIVLLLCLPTISKCSNYFEKDLDRFYNNIISAQKLSNLQNSDNAPYPSKLLNLSQLGLALENNDKGITLEMIVQVYNNIDSKEKYESDSSLFLKNIKLESINLTVFHLCEDLAPVGKKLPLLFANQGPPVAVLQKKAQGTVLNYNNSLCGMPTLSEREGCFTSLEEILKFVTKRMGEDVKAVSPLSGKWQKYMVSGIPKVISRQVTGCHKVKFNQFGVYKCHNFPGTIARTVPLTGEDGVKLEAISICHMQTDSWNPQYLAFRVLGTKPGIPVCHFLATDDIIWLTNSPPPTGTNY